MRRRQNIANLMMSSKGIEKSEFFKLMRYFDAYSGYPQIGTLKNSLKMAVAYRNKKREGKLRVKFSQLLILDAKLRFALFVSLRYSHF
jgi:hypothetical protein